MLETISLETIYRNQFMDITDRIKQLRSDNNWENGIIYLHVPHTTAGLTINENADPDVMTDMFDFIKKLVPNSPKFAHMEGNSDAHIKSTLFGPTLNIIVNDGELLLGTWQGIYFCEFDGPRKRTVQIKFISEK